MASGVNGIFRFRSPSYEASWVTSLLAVLDSAALYLPLCPEAAPAVPARLCLRSGLLCFGEVARSINISAPVEPAPDAGISLTYEDFRPAPSAIDADAAAAPRARYAVPLVQALR